MSLIIFKQLLQIDSAFLVIQKKGYYNELVVFFLNLQVISFSPFVEMLKKINWGCEYVDFMLKKKFFIPLFFCV
jgi:hypothetical protein